LSQHYEEQEKANNLKFSATELTIIREIPPLEVLKLLGWHIKQDRDYRPTNTQSIRIHISKTFDDRHLDYELVVTGRKWFETHTNYGSTGAIDLVIHLYKEFFIKAVERIKQARDGVLLERNEITIQNNKNTKTLTDKPKIKRIPIKEPIKVLKHNKKDYYLTDTFELPNWKPKNDMPSMEHPLFSLSNKSVQELKSYERDGVSITIIPGKSGYATIFDKDLWIYCTSLILNSKNQHDSKPARTIYFKLYDFLKATSRTTSGVGYKLAQEALSRLKGTIIKAEIDTKDLKMKGEFGLIDHWWIIEKSPDNNRMEAIAVTISDWLYRSISNTKVLTLNPDYFKLRKPLERRIYELARKHCGNQKTWKISLDNIYQKSGSTATQKEFKRQIKKIVADKNIPDYSIRLENDGMLYFFNQHPT